MNPFKLMLTSYIQCIFVKSVCSLKIDLTRNLTKTDFGILGGKSKKDEVSRDAEDPVLKFEVKSYLQGWIKTDHENCIMRIKLFWLCYMKVQNCELEITFCLIKKSLIKIMKSADTSTCSLIIKQKLFWN